MFLLQLCIVLYTVHDHRNLMFAFHDTPVKSHYTHTSHVRCRLLPLNCGREGTEAPLGGLRALGTRPSTFRCAADDKRTVLMVALCQFRVILHGIVRLAV